MRPTPTYAKAAALVVLTSTLAACSWSPPLVQGDRLLGLVTPFRTEIVQGNVVTQEMAAALKPGMSRAQVRETLGSPLLADIFHADRWDYVFTIRRQGAPYQQRRLTVLFDGDGMKSYEADELPSERDFVDSIDATGSRGKTVKLELTEEQLKALPAPKTAAAAPTAAVQGPARAYPPLEPSP